MIHCKYGKLGAGKGLVVMEEILREIHSGFRDIVTNVPVCFGPWVNGSSQPQMGLLAYLQRDWGDSFNVSSRLLVIPDMSECQAMYLWRRNPSGPMPAPADAPTWWKDAAQRGWFKLRAMGQEGKEHSFDPEPIKALGTAPVLIVSDEAWAYYSAKRREGIPPVSDMVEFYGRQQRKLRDEWVIVTQHHNDLHCMFERVAQTHSVIRNHGMERLGIFRQPAFFRVQQFNQIPKAGAKVEREFAFRLDAGGLAQCYDTSAGVGVAGGFQADYQNKRKGINIIWLFAAVVLAVGLLAGSPWILGGAVSGWLGKIAGGGGMAHPTKDALAGKAAPPPPPPQQARAVPVAPLVSVDTRPRFVNSCSFNGQGYIITADGQRMAAEYLAPDGRLALVNGEVWLRGAPLVALP